MRSESNPLGMQGIDFVEWGTPNPGTMHEIFQSFGFSRLHEHNTKNISAYTQHDITFFLNSQEGSFSEEFGKLHGPSISALGLRVEDAAFAFEEAVRRGARAFAGIEQEKAIDAPAIYGIGNSLLYFVDNWQNKGVLNAEFKAAKAPDAVEEKGFLAIDHLTNNVYKGTMETWANFYKDIFGFQEVRYFDIKGQKTGLTSYALQSPDKTFCIPINEGNEKKSQIEEYLDEYNGPGIQHLAFLTHDLLESLDRLEGSGIETLDIHPNYYKQVFDRVPNVIEDHAHIERHQVLVDGDEDGYLLQIFTKNLFGPIFIELIQRKNHKSFGEGNFQALFESIERDQERRGVL